jgi:RNA-directed DNA polymerase
MNLFMTYAFDEWMKRECPKTPFCRYADDGAPRRREGVLMN